MSEGLSLTVDHSSAVGVSVCGVVDGPPPQFPGLLHRHLVAVGTVQHTIGIGGARAHTEQVVGESRAVRVHVIQTRSLQRRGKACETPCSSAYASPVVISTVLESATHM